MIKDITSLDNKIYKQTKKLLTRQERYKTGLFVAEGTRIVKDAVESGAVEYLFINEAYEGPLYDLTTYRVSNKMFSSLTDTETTQGIIAVCKMQKCSVEDIFGDTLLVCDGVSDPGNLGTLIRSAECSGADGVVLLGGTVDPYSPKVVRSTMGSIFRVPVYFADISDITKLDEYKFVVTMLSGADDLYTITMPEKVAIVVGNEAHGVSDKMIDLAHIRAYIPMCGNAESLNASVAGSIVLYENLRQKSINK